MLYAQTLKMGAKFEYHPRTFKGIVTLKDQTGHTCTVVDEDGVELVVTSDDLTPVDE